MTDIKDSFAQKFNLKQSERIEKLIMLLITFTLLICTITFLLLVVYIGKLEKCNENLKEIKTKVHHRYFNITRSLEDIHDVKIETHTGKVIKEN